MGLFCQNSSSTYWCKTIRPHSQKSKDQRLWRIWQLHNHHHWYSYYQSLKLVLDIHRRMLDYFHCYKLLKSRKKYYVSKFVCIFWEGHLTFVYSTYRQKLCGLLRIYIVDRQWCGFLTPTAVAAGADFWNLQAGWATNLAFPYSLIDSIPAR